MNWLIRSRLSKIAFMIASITLLSSTQSVLAFNAPTIKDFYGEIVVNGKVAQLNEVGTPKVEEVDSVYGRAKQTTRVAANDILIHTLTLLERSSSADTNIPSNTIIATHTIKFKKNATFNSFEGCYIELPRNNETRLSYGSADNTSYQVENNINILAVPGYSKDGRMRFGGTPFNNVWNRSGGLYVSVLASQPETFELPISVSQTHIEMFHKYIPNASFGEKTSFSSGESIQFSPIMVGLHKGDFFTPLRDYVKKLEEIEPKKKYIDVSLGNSKADEPYWKTWGLVHEYEEDGEEKTRFFTVDEILDVADILEKKDISRIMLDYGWFKTEGLWDVDKNIDGFSDNKSLIDLIVKLKQRGFQVGLWYQPLQVDPDYDHPTIKKLLKKHAVRKKDGGLFIDDDEVALLDPSKPEVLKLVKAQLKEFNTWGVDHIYLDSQVAQLAIPPNFSLNHPNQLNSHKELHHLYKLIRDDGETYGMTIEICPDGRSQTILNMPQAVTNIGDPKDDQQLRSEHRWLKAIQGSRSIVGTYVEKFEDNGTSGSFLNIIGIGGNIQSIGNLLPQSNENTNSLDVPGWDIWMDFYNQHQLVTADYLPLYDIGFDYPEGHVLRRGNKTYYSFFSRENGTMICTLKNCIDSNELEVADIKKGMAVNKIIDLRGLEANTQYQVTSFPNASDFNQVIKTNNKGLAEVHLSFKKEFLLIATPLIIPTPEFSLPKDEWRQVSLPSALPNNQNTVEAVFADDLIGIYDEDWRVFSYDSVKRRYINVGLKGTLVQGKGYWIINKSTSAIVDLPTGSTTTTVMPSSVCMSSKGCYSFKITTDKEQDVLWNMLGLPFKNGVSMSRWRVVTKSGACSTGCTLDKAEIQKVAHNKIWSYKDKAYKLLEGNEIIEPWVGFWMAGYKEANGLEPTLIIPID